VDIFSGLVWRHVPRGAHALHVGWILRATGRWNRRGAYGCLYTALTAQGAVAEYRRYAARVGSAAAVRTRDLVSIRVNRLGPVLDLTDAVVRAKVGIAASALTGDDTEDLTTCLAIADWARAERYQGLLTPSAADARQTNLIIYVDGPAGNVDLDEGPDRLPID
jgi:RES domain-containing protein